MNDNQINLKELHGALLWYFRQEAKFDEQENWGDSSTDEQAVSRRPQQHVSSVDVKFCTAVPLEPQCPLSSTPTVLPADEFEEVEFYCPDEDRWVCGLASKMARTEEGDQDVEMKSVDPHSNKGASKEGKGGKSGKTANAARAAKSERLR